MANIWITNDTTFYDFYAQHERGLWILDPEHQREVVHSNKWKSGIINSALIFGEIPQVYWHQVENYRKESLDGKQRCSAIVEFLGDKFRFEPETPVPPQYEHCRGKKFTEFPDEAKEALGNTHLSCKVLMRTMTTDEISRFFLDRQVTKVTTLGEKLNAQLQSRIRSQAIIMLKEDEDINRTLKEVKKNGSRKAHIELLGRLMYAHRHPEDDGLDPSPKDLTDWFATGEPFPDHELMVMKRFIEETILIVNKAPKTWGWRPSSKTTLLAVYNVLQKYSSVDGNAFDVMYSRIGDENEAIRFVGVNGDHNATKRHRDALLQAFPELNS